VDLILQESEEERIYNLVYELTILKPGLKAAFLIATPG
jgi:hypothetical protein